MRANRFRAVVLASGLSTLASLGCDSPRPVSEPSATPAAPAIEIRITGVTATAGAVRAQYTVTRGGQPLDAQSVSALRPSWTLAGLEPNPVSGIPAWQSFLLTGGQTVATLPIEGPGTPDGAVLHDVKQPGSENGGTVEDLGGGAFAYTFRGTLPEGLDPATTVRAGVYLSGTPGTPQTSSTFDFTPGGGPVTSRELVLDANCNQCHGVIQAHGGFRTGTKLCLTCHTIQNADPDTVDPAALVTATPATNPNPLDLGRLVHRIHRGKDMPTLRDAGTGALVVGRKYSVIGFRSSETVYGRALNRTDNGQPALAVAEGVGFPRDLRSCQACHGGAPEESERFAAISRRTCAGCHADVWYLSTPIPAEDRVHRVHGGGPQADDTRCASCHVPSAENPTVESDITAIHVTPYESPRWNKLTAQIVGVENMRPGQMPTVVFTLTDRDGTPTPLNAPTPATDEQSPVPRALTGVTILLSGPTVPDMLTGNAPISGSVPLTTAADDQGRFRFTFTRALPEDASGTWAVGLEARRSRNPTDPAAWPFTGEGVTEWADNPVVYVDTSAGTFPGGAPVARRAIVDRAKCEACHGVVRVHGDLRHNPEYCVMCHTPDATDWTQRPKAANGNVALGSTYDGIEERSIHLTTLLHRIHTGTHQGAAGLGLSEPMVVYGFRGSVNFLGDVEFPGDLSQCVLCHVPGAYRVEAVPPNAPPMIANETASIIHQATAAHPGADPRRLPITAACMGCHDTGAALAHARRNTINGRENCAACHGRNGFMSVDEVHGVQAAR